MVARIEQPVYFFIELTKGNATFETCVFKEFGRNSIPGGSDSQNFCFLIQLRKGNEMSEAYLFKKFGRKSIPGCSEN